MDLAYDRQEWDAALESAEVFEWDPIDAGEKHGPVAQFLCDRVIDHDVIGNDPDVIVKIFEVLADNGEDEFSPERLVAVLDGWETGAWRTT